MTRFLLVLSICLIPVDASACGGFFCDNLLVPVDQTAERILFRVNADETITTFVEISYTGEPEQFAWVIPTPVPLDVADIEVRGAELFDELEVATRPRFRFVSASGASAERSSGCGGFDGREAPDPFWEEDVEVLATLDIGPFSLEVIEATDAENFNIWLAVNGYATTATADGALGHYIDGGMAFLGVKLNPSAVEGPLDTLVFSYPAREPMIPIILTAIAAVDDMEVLTYVLADEPYTPSNYGVLDFDFDLVERDGNSTTYEALLPGAVDDAGGHAFAVELAQPVANLSEVGETAAEVLATGRYLTRMRTYLSADEMTVDPMFSATPGAADVSNLHDVPDREMRSGWGEGTLAYLIPALVLLGFLVRRRRASTG